MDEEIFFIIGDVGNQIGTPYNTIGFMSESKSVVWALKEIFDLSTVFFKPWEARIALSLRVDCANFKLPDLFNTIPR